MNKLNILIDKKTTVITTSMDSISNEIFFNTCLKRARKETESDKNIETFTYQLASDMLYDPKEHAQ